VLLKGNEGEKMAFSYNEYFNSLFILPLIMCAISVVVILAMIIYSLNLSSPFTIKFKFDFSISVIVCIILFIVFASSLRYGVKMLNDNENSAIIIDGEIEEIEKVTFSPRYMYNDRVVFAKVITINGEKYYCMTVGDLAVGDYVEASYMKNSRLVIKIDLYDDNQ
jgi:hypothetical protein